ncbi:baseplate assembly protein [Paraburkholderia phosphatilytica]|uniref:baseplate assembly protein n=1 Tax=Paraburkholderia phosphatilytica TaxID=2282883 RepID=UPI000F601E81|nr:baseplate assembly protein [Paraburkholderia phosphatilytica]
MGKHLANAMSQRAALAMLDLSMPRTGFVTSYDPNAYAVKVLIQPENLEVPGWIPLGAAAIGNGFGIVSGPNVGSNGEPGDMVQVTFDGGSPDAPRITGRFFNTVDMPPGPVPSGDTWIVHPSTSCLKFNADGTITVTANAQITYTATQHNFVGPVQMQSTLLVEEEITGQGGMAISGTNSNGQTSTVTGNMNINGNVATEGTLTNNGTDVGSGHYHGNGNGGANTTPPVG